MAFVEADWQGRPVIVCRTGYTGERGYELRARAGTTRRPLWDALHRGGRAVRRPALRPGRPRHAAHRDGLPAARPGPVASRSPRCRPGPAGRWAGRRTRSGAGRRCVAEKADGRAPPAWGLLATGRGIPRRALRRCRSPTARSSARSRPGTFSPTLKQGIALALLAPPVRRGRRGRRSTCAAAGRRARSSSRRSCRSRSARPDRPPPGPAARRRLRRRAAGRPRRPSGPPRERPRPPPRGRRR